MQWRMSRDAVSSVFGSPMLPVMPLCTMDTKRTLYAGTTRTVKARVAELSVSDDSAYAPAGSTSATTESPGRISVPGTTTFHDEAYVPSVADVGTAGTVKAKVLPRFGPSLATATDPP